MAQSEVLIVGGGNAGISLAAKLLRDGVSGVTVVAPQPLHRYKPLLNYVGGGEATMADLERPMADVVPDGCTWMRDAVAAVDADTSTVRTRLGRTLRYSTLVALPRARGGLGGHPRSARGLRRRVGGLHVRPGQHAAGCGRG